MRVVRVVLAVIFGLVGAALAALELLILNPVWGVFSLDVEGPILLNSLLIAYGVPALIFAIVAVKMPHLKQLVRRFFLGLAIVYTVLLIGLEIRHLWFGNDMGINKGVYDGELYSYTIAMLLSSAGLLFLAFSKRNKMMWRFAMIGIGLTIAKVFLLDMAGLAGLIRVASFLGLGLSLAGLAWINGNMSRQWGDDASEGDPVVEPADV